MPGGEWIRPAPDRALLLGPLNEEKAASTQKAAEQLGFIVDAQDPRRRVVACPGLGTGIGRMPFPEAARQMALAWCHFLRPPRGITWAFATGRQGQIARGGDLGAALPKSQSGW